MSTFDGEPLIAAHQAPAMVGVPAGTVRYWASNTDTHDGEPLLAARGLDRRHRPLYAKADLEALRDRPRRRAARPHAVDTGRATANTAADGTRVSTPLSCRD